MNQEDKRLEMLLEIIDGLQDPDFQKRIWVLQEGPEVDSFDDSINAFFLIYEGLKLDLIEDPKKMGLTPFQFKVLDNFAKVLDHYCEITSDDILSREVVSDPRWNVVIAEAKKAYKILCA